MKMRRVAGVAVKEVLVRIPLDVLEVVDAELEGRKRQGERVSRSCLIAEALESYLCPGAGV